MKMVNEMRMEEALEALEDACYIFYEIDSAEGIALAVMTESLLKYGNAILEGKDPRLSEDQVFSHDS